MKQCSICRKPKRKSLFARDRNKKSGTSSRCKDCDRIRSSRRLENPINRERHRTMGRMRMREQKRNYPEKVLWHMAKQRAKRKHIPFSITPDDIHIPRTCPLLGILLKVGQGTPNDSSPSLDRIIPSEGYTPKNIQVISYRANRLKADASIPEMETLLKNWRKIEDSRGNTDMAVSLQAVFAARKNEEDA